MICRVLFSASAFLSMVDNANELKKQFNFHLMLSKDIKFSKLTADKGIMPENFC